MTPRIKRICTLVFSFSLAFFVLACEGGKTKNTCDSNASGPYSSNCQANKPDSKCPLGQERVNGLCKATQKSCPNGQILQNGECSALCPSGQHLDDGHCTDDDINIEVVSRAACNADNGYKQIIMQFIARDNKGFAIDPELNSQNVPTVLESSILIDGKPANVESLISRQSELLKSDLVLSLVLDASKSMLEHNPPAFKPMKEAAIAILQQTKTKWNDNNSKFDWRVLWFNDYLYKPSPDADGQLWSIEDIDRIPSPSGGTELYKAINHMAGIHQNLIKNGVASKARDQHVMIVLSDGEDTHSHVDNKDHLAPKNLDDSLYWTEFGSAAVSKEQLINNLSAGNKNLKVHVIGFGQYANTKGELEQISQAGNGLYFDSSATNANALKTVFEDVQKEFITIQTIGVTTSLPNGVYEFSIKAKHAVTLAEGTSNEPYTVEVGPGLPNCQQ